MLDETWRQASITVTYNVRDRVLRFSEKSH